MIIKQGLRATRLTYTVEIEDSSEDIWKVISAPGNLAYCHPFCKANPVEKWGGVGARDTIEYHNGLTLTRRFTKWTEGKGYDLLIGKGKYALASVQWEIKPQIPDRSNFSIAIDLYSDLILNSYPKIFRTAVRKFYLLPQMSKYVRSVVKGFKYHIESGRPVRPNQFGYNRMFSVRHV